MSHEPAVPALPAQSTQPIQSTQPPQSPPAEGEALDRLQRAGEGDGGQPSERYGTFDDQVLERYGPPQAAALVLVHGGYFRPSVDRVHTRPMARALAEAGWQVVLPEYRRVPGAPCTATEDLAALDEHLRQQGADVHAWVGHSAGGALVLWRGLAPELPPTRVVALAPVADFDAAVAEGLGRGAVRDWIGDGPQESPLTYARLDPTRMAARAPRALDRLHLVHGTEDVAVPITQSRGFPAATTEIEGAHHFDLIDPSSLHWARVAAIIRG